MMLGKIIYIKWPRNPFNKRWRENNACVHLGQILLPTPRPNVGTCTREKFSTSHCGTSWAKLAPMALSLPFAHKKQWCIQQAGSQRTTLCIALQGAPEVLYFVVLMDCISPHRGLKILIFPSTQMNHINSAVFGTVCTCKRWGELSSYSSVVHWSTGCCWS